MTLLVIDDLRIAGTGGAALAGVSLDLRHGETLGLLDEDGAAGALLAGALLGLLPPGALVTGGRILLNGESVEALTAAAWRQRRGRVLAALFRDIASALDPLRAVGVQLAETLSAHRPQLTAKMLRDRVADWLDAAGLPKAAWSAYPVQLVPAPAAPARSTRRTGSRSSACSCDWRVRRAVPSC